MVRPGRFAFVKSVVPDEVVERELAEAMGESAQNSPQLPTAEKMPSFEMGAIVGGRVLRIVGDDVIVDIRYKSEGSVPLVEFNKHPQPGDEIEVFIEDLDEETGEIILSKRRADRIRGWERIMSEHKVGDVVKGRAIRKIKGGLLVDIGVPVFLPASQVDLRRSPDVSEYVGKELECKIIKIDRDRRNIVLSRRRLLEEERDRRKSQVLQTLVKGEIRKGIVKNITEFGAFIDLGGIDGLLHITDMSWGRVSHPSEILAPEQEIEVKVLDFDIQRERISLGLKQIQPSPWEKIEEKYPVGTRLKGTVVNIVPYGCFVKLEDGIEGLVHVSEMSWTRTVNHPSEVVKPGETVEVVVLDINKEKQEISLGMKQCESNPWDDVESKYPIGMIVEGKVRNMTNYGAFIELEAGIDGLLHVNDISWTKKIGHPSAVLKKGETIKAVVLAVDRERKRVALGIKHLTEDPWVSLIPQKFHISDVVEGTVTKLTNFGAFVEIAPDLEGLLHISEMSDHKIEKPEEVLKTGDRVTVMIINIDPKERKIGLSLRATQGIPTPVSPAATETAQPSAAAEPPAANDAAPAADDQP